MPTATYTVLLDTDGDGVAEYDATADVRYERHLVIGRGRDQAREYSPPLSGVILTSFDNQGGKYSYNNPTSPLYGLLIPGRLEQVQADFATPQGYAATVLADVPSGHWRLGDLNGTSATDASGNAKHGTYTGGYTLAQTGAIGGEVDGTSNKAVTLNGTTGRITIPSITIAGSSLTLETWVKMSSAQDGIFLSQSSSGTYLRAFSSRLPYAQVVLTSGTYAVTGPTAFTLGVWYHVALTWTSGGFLRLYVNGVQVAISALTVAGTVSPAITAPEIGSFYGGIFWNGLLDEVALYPSELSAARILAHYNAGINQANSTTTATTYQLGRAYLRLPTEQPYRTQAQVDWDAYDGLAKLVAAENISTAMYTSITTSTAIGHVLDAAGWPAGLRTIDTGITTLARWWVDGINAFEAIKHLVLTEGPGSVFYIDGSGNFVFESRHYRQLTTRSTTSQATFSGSGNEPLFGTAFEYEPGLRGIVNSCVVPVRSYESTAGVTIWSAASGELPATVSPLATRTFAVTCSADGFSGATVNITYSSGSGSTSLSRTSGKTSVLTVTAGAAGCVISALSVTAATWAISTTSVTNSISTATSIANYGVRSFPSDLIPVWIPTANEARDYCDFVVGRYKDPRPQVRFSVTNANGIRLTQALNRKISDRVTVVEGTRAFLNDDFFIESTSHDISTGLNQKTTFSAEKASTNAAWRLGITGYSELGSTTFLGY